MKNPIPYNSMFRDFDSLNQLMGFLERTYTGPERADMLMIVQFTFNACHKVVNDAYDPAGLLTEESAFCETTDNIVERSGDSLG
jgi:hypothetical protein